MNDYIDPFIDPVRQVNVRVIENGYIVSLYYQNRPIEWYCISLEEVAEKMARYI